MFRSSWMETGHSGLRYGREGLFVGLFHRNLFREFLGDVAFVVRNRIFVRIPRGLRGVVAVAPDDAEVGKRMSASIVGMTSRWRGEDGFGSDHASEGRVGAWPPRR